eukprot:5517777-Karenia_brevis.AAC.1
MATAALGVRARQSAGPFGLDEEIMKALRFITGPLRMARPRELDFKDPRPPVVVFTDGACEGTDYVDATYGAVIFVDGVVQALGGQIPPKVVDHWRGDGRKQVIGQAELWPVLVARMTWPGFLRGRRVIYYIDNDSARFALVNQSSPSKMSMEILWEVASVEAEILSLPWYARVPSESNCSD